MKVLHLINTLAVGGAEMHLLALCSHLKKHGLDIVVVCLREHVKGSRSLRPEFVHEHIRIVNLHADSRYDCRFLGRFVRVLKEEHPDIVHTHLPRADFAGCLGRLLCPSIPWVSSVHDIYSKSWSGKWTLPLLNVFWRRADAVIAISHAVKDWLVQERHVPVDKVAMIHYGIESGRFAHPPADGRDPANPGRGVVVGTIGRLEPRKGHAGLIRAMPTVLQHIPNASLLIAGHDPWSYGRTLQALITALGLSDRVQLVGFCDDVPAFLRAVEVFAFASRAEGFGQVLLEAMAAGRPVVASKIAPHTEIVVDGETGFLVELDNAQAFATAMSRLLLHPEEAQRMGQQGQERVCTHFSMERMVAETLSLYHAMSGVHPIHAPIT
jgi:glycosyltransferase involved in cell wall biosynthesis